MKNIKAIIIASALSIVLIASAVSAKIPETVFEVNSESYAAPILVESVCPEPVWYAPGRTVEGYVTLELKVGTSGTVESVRVLYRTSPLAVKSAVRAVENWKFKPAIFDGEPVTVWVAYSLPFGNNLQVFANDNYAHRILNPTNGEQIALK